MKKILITGGCGFIGSNFVRYIREKYPDYQLVNLDLLTYAGKLENLAGIDEKNYSFIKGDIGDKELVIRLFKEYDFDTVINFAAETHVDRSIKDPRIFVETNVCGTMNLLDCTYSHWNKKRSNWQEDHCFFQISTDEVYGTLPEDNPHLKFTEDTPLAPNSPYSSTKTSADLLVRAYHKTYGLPILITRCSNNYGQYQDREKLIPLIIYNAFHNKRLPVYGDGRNIRDWLYVLDHCSAIDIVLHKGRVGEVYNIGGLNEWQNIDIVKFILKYLNKPESLIEYVADRPGHDRRYAIDNTKISTELGWSPGFTFEEGLKRTIEWYSIYYRGKNGH
ncbi:MAG: dTDP-glucose 4,6-dehydratase [bacterium]